MKIERNRRNLEVYAEDLMKEREREGNEGWKGSKVRIGKGEVTRDAVKGVMKMS